MNSTALARKAVEVLSDKKGIDTLLLDIRNVSLLADYFIISTGEVDRHIQGMVDELSQELQKEQVSPLHIEGNVESGWVILDYGNVVVHLFSPQMRQYYRLEELWKDARIVVRIQ